MWTATNKVVVAGLAVLALASAVAASPMVYVWTGPNGVDHTWSRKQNWDQSSKYPGNNDPGDTARFNTSPDNVLLDVDTTIAVFDVIGTNSWTWSGTRTLTVTGTFSYASSGSSVFSAKISGSMSGGLVKSGTGTLVLSNSNSYTGLTTVSGGILGITTDLALGATGGGTTVSGSGTLRLDNVQYLSLESLTLNGSGYSGQGALRTASGSSKWAGAVTLATDSVIQAADASTLTISGAIGGSGKLTKTGSGLVILTGTNTYQGGTLISLGILETNSWGLCGNVTDNAVLRFNQALNGTCSRNISGSGSVIKIGDAVLVLTGSNSYTGGTTISAGTLRGNTTSLQGSVTNNATLEFAQSSVGTFVGTINGGGTVRVTGAGKVTVTTAQPYTGQTIVSDTGRLQLRADAPNTDVTLLSGGQLLGHGAVHSITVGPGGILSPGESPGVLEAESNIWQGGGTYLFEVDSVTAGGGSQATLAGADPGADTMTITGTLDITASQSNKFIIDIRGLAHATHDDGAVANWSNTSLYQWVIATASDGIVGFDPDAFELRTDHFANNNSTDGGHFAISRDGNNVVLTYVPEPATLMLISMGGLALLARRRR